MALTLYGGARSRASMVRWYLEEKGIPYSWQPLDMAAGEHRQAPFTAINPFGKVPALVDDGLSGPDGEALKLFESGAILLHLAEGVGQEFTDPATAQARRSLTAQWLLFANATLGPALIAGKEKPAELDRLLAVLEPRLEPGTSLLAGRWGNPGWGAADCVVQAYLAYLPLFLPEHSLSSTPRIAATIAATAQRPAYRRVMGLG
jgi:glutathione S-transferase